MRFFSHKPNYNTVMARQKGIIKLKGTIGDVSFYKTKDGYLAREKGGVDGDRIKNDPAFQRTRENGSEFGRAGRSGKILRNAFRLMLQNASDSKVTSRLTKQMLKVIQADSVNPRGARTIKDGDLDILSGFDFNKDGRLNATMYSPFDTDIDRAAGTLTVSIDAFVPGTTIAYPAGATHMRLLAGAAEVNFETEAYQFDQVQSADLVLGPQNEAAFDLVATVTANSVDDLFLLLGIVFLQEVNGVMYPLKTGSSNPLAIVAIDQPSMVQV
jgi:hypothetical protein